MSILRVEFETKCNSGFPILLKAEIGYPEPDVGLPDYYIRQWEILNRQGQPANFLKISKLEETRLENEILDYVMNNIGRSL